MYCSVLFMRRTPVSPMHKLFWLHYGYIQLTCEEIKQHVWQTSTEETQESVLLVPFISLSGFSEYSESFPRFNVSSLSLMPMLWARKNKEDFSERFSKKKMKKKFNFIYSRTEFQTAECGVCNVRPTDLWGRVKLEIKTFYFLVS